MQKKFTYFLIGLIVVGLFYFGPLGSFSGKYVNNGDFWEEIETIEIQDGTIQFNDEPPLPYELNWWSRNLIVTHHPPFPTRIKVGWGKVDYWTIKPGEWITFEKSDD